MTYRAYGNPEVNPYAAAAIILPLSVPVAFPNKRRTDGEQN